jgi:peptidyl-prolyl cis-trans isomerase D
MAVIGAIQKRIWIVFVFIAIALVGFLIMDSTQSAGRAMGGGAKTEFASIGGEELSPDEYRNAVIRAQNDYLVRQQRVVDARQGNFRLDEATAFSLEEQAWEQLLNDKLLQRRLEASGIRVTDDEFANLIYGPKPHPYIDQLRMALPQFGIDPSQPNALQQFVQLVSNTQQWEQFPFLEQYYRDFLLREQASREERQESKYTDVIQRAAYTPAWLAQRDYQMQTTRLSFNYVLLPYRDIPDEEVSFTEAEVQARYKKMQNSFSEQQDTRNIEYVAFDVVATPADSQAVMSKLLEYRDQWMQESNDSAYLSLYSQDPLAYTNAWFRLDDLYNIAADSSRARELFAIESGTYTEPYQEGGAYKIARLYDRKRYPDSTSVRHIFLRLDDEANRPALRQRADSLFAVLVSGQKGFEQLAREHSDDDSNRDDGGDLGWINPNTPFFPELRTFIYDLATLNKPELVSSPIGFHIIEVVDKRNEQDHVRIAFLARNIRPSRETDDMSFEAAESFYERYGSDTLFDKGISELGYQKRISGTFRPNQYSIVNLPKSRPVIEWALGAELGDVQMFHLEDKHIVVRLRDKTDAGKPTLESVRAQVEAELINEKKADKLVAKMSDAGKGASDLNSIASNLGLSVLTASSATFAASFIPQVGNEAELIGVAFGMDLNKISEPIVGKQGVFIIEPTSVEQAEALDDYSTVADRLNTQERNRFLSTNLIEAFKKQVKVVDNRRLFN